MSSHCSYSWVEASDQSGSTKASHESAVLAFELVTFEPRVLPGSLEPLIIQRQVLDHQSLPRRTGPGITVTGSILIAGGTPQQNQESHQVKGCATNLSTEMMTCTHPETALLASEIAVDV